MSVIATRESMAEPASVLAGRHFLHVFPSFGFGGVPIRIAGVLNHLGPSLRHTVVALDGRFDARSRIDPNINLALEPIAVRGHGLPRTIAVVHAALRRMAPDLLLTYNWGAIEWALANTLVPCCPHVHFESGFGPEEAEHQIRRRVWMRRLALWRAKRLVVPSRRLVALASAVWKIDPAKILFIPNGVDCERFHGPAQGDVVPGLAKAPGELLVGTVAPLRPEKNVARLLRAFGPIAAQAPARLIVAGDGAERSRLIELAAALGIAERVVFAGHVERVEGLLPWLDVFAMSSDTEQMPNSLIQAMAAGLPVAATDVGDVKAILAPENAPFVVEKGDDSGLAGALGRLLGDPALRARIGACNRRRVRAEYNLAKMMRAYVRLYESVLVGAPA